MFGGPIEAGPIRFLRVNRNNGGEIGFGSDGEEAGGDATIGALACVAFFDEITSKLLAKELIISLVTIVGIDHPISVTLGVAENTIAIVAVGLGVASGIKPMPRPAFPKLRGRHEFVRQLGGGTVVGRVAEAG